MGRRAVSVSITLLAQVKVTQNHNGVGLVSDNGIIYSTRYRRQDKNSESPSVTFAN